MTARGKAHEALRCGTRAAHDRVDALFGRFDLARREDYADFLTAHAAALLPLEAALDRSGLDRIIDDWPQRRRACLLRADLDELGVAIPETEAAALGEEPASLLGALYVLEGSRMGGRLLARSVGKGLPVRYLAAEQALAPWRHLLEMLERALPDAASRDAAARSAAAAFDVFERAGRLVSKA